MKNYHNKIKIVVNEFACEYYECGSHQMELTIDINKDMLDEFISNIGKLPEDE